MEELKVVVGCERLEEMREEYCTRKLLPEVGLRTYNLVRYGGTQEEWNAVYAAYRTERDLSWTHLPADSIARLVAREVFDVLLSYEGDEFGCSATILENRNSSTVSFVSNRTVRVTFVADGFRSLCEDTMTNRSCTWADADFWTCLERCFSEVADVDISLAAIGSKFI